MKKPNRSAKKSVKAASGRVRTAKVANARRRSNGTGPSKGSTKSSEAWKLLGQALPYMQALHDDLRWSFVNPDGYVPEHDIRAELVGYQRWLINARRVLDGGTTR